MSDQQTPHKANRRTGLLLSAFVVGIVLSFGSNNSRISESGWQSVFQLSLLMGLAGVLYVGLVLALWYAAGRPDDLVSKLLGAAKHRLSLALGLSF